MKQIPKFQMPWQAIELANSTNVQKPLVFKPIKRTLRPGQIFLNIGENKILTQPKEAVISQDIRTDKQRKQDKTWAEQKKEKLKQEQLERKGYEVIGGLTSMAMPSHWIGVATSNKPFIETAFDSNVKASSNEGVNFALDMISPGKFIKGGLSLAALTLPIKHKFRNSVGKIWSQNDILSYLKKQKKNLNKVDIENFIRDNNLQSITMPNGDPGLLEIKEGTIAKGIEQLLGAKPNKKLERLINNFESLNIPKSYAGKFGYTIDARNGFRYNYNDLFNLDGTLRGGQNAFFRMRPSRSGKHGEANWRPKNETEEVEAILRNHFNGNPGETAIDAYTGKQVLNSDGSKRILSPLEAVTYENPSGVSGTYSNAIDGEYSLDSYLLLLSKLRRAKANGMRLQRSKYNSMYENGEKLYQDLVTLNGYGTKHNINVNLDPDFQKLLRNHYKDSHLSLDSRGLPKGTIITGNRQTGYKLEYNGKPVGTITQKNATDVFKKLKDAVISLNRDLNLKGKDALPLPTFDGVLRVPNPQFIIYYKGGKFIKIKNNK